MARNDNSTPKELPRRQQDSERTTTPLSWQPTVDRTTAPPTGDDD